MNPLIQLKKSTPLFVIPLSLLLTCFALISTAQAVGPDTDGAIAGGNNGEGIGVLVSRTSGVWNTGTGFEALNHLTSGNQNTATGFRALFSNTTGSFNTATGLYALYRNAGWYNSAVGALALVNNAGDWNTATGYQALQSNTTGANNTANGSFALHSNITGHSNTANGFDALRDNSSGGENTASGVYALLDNATGNSNTANGAHALFRNRTGDGNTANGAWALLRNTYGGFNTANGYFALVNNTTGFNNTALGINAGMSVTTASNVIAIGTAGANVSNTCFIGNIRGVTTANANAIPVLIDSAGQLGTLSSSRRFKDEIKPMDKASEAILALKPVTFHYKSDKTGTPQFGLIAEEVAEVNPDLVVRDENGEIYTVRSDAVNAMLLNEFLKEHSKNEEQEKTIAQLKSGMTALAATVKEQAAQIQKVSAQLEASKPGPQVVNNP